jgi:hypothetical protein
MIDILAGKIDSSYIEFYNQNAKPMKWNFYPKKETANAPVDAKGI